MDNPFEDILKTLKNCPIPPRSDMTTPELITNWKHNRAVYERKDK
jgi:hypothetical protein